MENNNSYHILASKYFLYEFCRLNFRVFFFLSTFFFICEVGDALILHGEARWQLISGLFSIASYFLYLRFFALREKIGCLLQSHTIKS